MKYTYTLNNEFNILIRKDENGIEVSIPIDPDNSDYQRYLNPEAEQSTPNLLGE
jgi:hypothetical protein